MVRALPSLTTSTALAGLLSLRCQGCHRVFSPPGLVSRSATLSLEVCLLGYSRPEVSLLWQPPLPSAMAADEGGAGYDAQLRGVGNWESLRHPTFRAPPKLGLRRMLGPPSPTQALLRSILHSFPFSLQPGASCLFEVTGIRFLQVVQEAGSTGAVRKERRGNG